VAFALRPFDPTGRSRVSQIDIDGSAVVVDGHRALYLSRAPSRVAVGSAEIGDSLGPVITGEATAQWPDGGVRCDEGRASAALLFPLPHTATIRVLVPLAAPVERRSRRASRSTPRDVEMSPSAAVEAARVVAGWEVQTRRSSRLELLERRAPEALRAARRFALLHAAGDDAASWSEGLVDVFEACSLIVALDQHGFHAEAARLIMGLVDRIDVDGRFEQEHHRIDAGAAWLHAVARHVALADDAVLARSVAADIAKFASRVHRDVMGLSSRRRSARAGGPAWCGDTASIRVHDLIWAQSGLLAAQFTLRVAQQDDAAEDVARFAAALLSTLDQSLDRAGDDIEVAMAAIVALAESDSPLLATDRVRASGLLERLAVDSISGAVWHRVGGLGMSPRLSAALAMAMARLGDSDAVLALRWMLDVAEPTWAWPTVVHPHSGGGSGGDGHSPASTAAFLRLVRALTALDDAEGVDLLPAVPAEWLGQPIEVHDLPTRHGRLSFAIRWHGERPALLWDLVAQTDPEITGSGTSAKPVTLRCSGLDPAWSTMELRGEALLAAPELGLAMDAADLGAHQGDEAVPLAATETPDPPAPGASFS